VMSDRAWILLPSGKQLDLLAPDPWAWTDDDLAIGLSRTYRWAGYSAWDLPLSVAQHSLAVLALRRSQSAEPPLPIAEARRELLHDATEALMGGWDPITPLKPHLGPGFSALVARLQAAVNDRYDLPAWTAADHAQHKRADRLAAAFGDQRLGGRHLAEQRAVQQLLCQPQLVCELLVLRELRDQRHQQGDVAWRRLADLDRRRVAHEPAPRRSGRSG